MLRMTVTIALVLGSLPAAAESLGPPAPGPAIPDDRCAARPVVRAVGFRHKRSTLIAKTGAANHRGIDVIAREDDPVQHVAGKLAAGKLDKDIEDEDVEVFACVDRAWRSLGTARTDDDGRFQLGLQGATRLPRGMRDLYVAALGDGAGAWFVGYVARKDEAIVVTDVDGTITWSENAIIKSAINGSDIKPRPHAPLGFQASPHVVVYVTARGDVFTELTRAWLARHGFPRGVMRLSRGAFARPGKDAIAYKTSILRSLSVPVAAGIGNRKSDIVAYTNAGVPANRILIHLPAYAQEVKPELAAGKAIGFLDYRKLPALLRR